MAGRICGIGAVAARLAVFSDAQNRGLSVSHPRNRSGLFSQGSSEERTKRHKLGSREREENDGEAPTRRSTQHSRAEAPG